MLLGQRPTSTLLNIFLEEGADPNAQDHRDRHRWMRYCSTCLGAMFLLNWPTTDANITTRSGLSFPVRVRQLLPVDPRVFSESSVRGTSSIFPIKFARADNPDRIQHHPCSSSGVALRRCCVGGKGCCCLHHNPLSSGLCLGFDVVFGNHVPRLSSVTQRLKSWK
jgi:hypothetical protein